MIAASLLALLSLGAPAMPAAATHYAGETVRASKGHASLPARMEAAETTGANTVCHPDPNKGRACRHHVAKKEEARNRDTGRPELADADLTQTPR